MIHDYYVYIMTNERHTVLYIGVTNSLSRRGSEHNTGIGSKFTKKYNVHKLVYYEQFSDPETAIKREKQMKNYSRKKKEALISKFNKDWVDISPDIS